MKTRNRDLQSNKHGSFARGIHGSFARGILAEELKVVRPRRQATSMTRNRVLRSKKIWFFRKSDLSRGAQVVRPRRQATSKGWHNTCAFDSCKCTYISVQPYIPSMEPYIPSNEPYITHVEIASR